MKIDPIRHRSPGRASGSSLPKEITTYFVDTTLVRQASESQ